MIDRSSFEGVTVRLSLTGEDMLTDLDAVTHEGASLPKWSEPYRLVTSIPVVFVVAGDCGRFECCEVGEEGGIRIELFNVPAGTLDEVLNGWDIVCVHLSTLFVVISEFRTRKIEESYCPPPAAFVVVFSSIAAFPLQRDGRRTLNFNLRSRNSSAFLDFEDSRTSFRAIILSILEGSFIVKTFER